MELGGNEADESGLERAGVRPVHIRVLRVDGGYFRGKMAEKSLSLSPEATESLGSLESIHREGSKDVMNHPAPLNCTYEIPVHKTFSNPLSRLRGKLPLYHPFKIPNPSVGLGPNPMSLFILTEEQVP